MTMQATISKPRFSLDPLAIFLSVTDASWVYIFAWLFGRTILGSVTIFSVPHPILLALVEFGAIMLTTYLIRRGASDASLRITMALVGLGVAGSVAFIYSPLNGQKFDAIFFVPFFFIALITLGVWAVGSNRGTRPDSYESAYFHFRLGLGAIVVSTLFATLVSGSSMNSLWSQLWGVVLLFFGSGLASLALGNRDTVRRESADSGLSSWGGLLAGSVGGVLVLGILAQALGAGDIITTIQNVVLGVLSVIATILYVITLIVTWPFTFCNISIAPNPNATPRPAVTPAPDQTEPFQKFQRENGGYNPINIPVEWQAILMVIAGLLVTAAILFFLFRWLSVRRVRQSIAVEEEHERFGSWALLWAQLRAWWDRLLGRFRRPVVAEMPVEEDDLALLQGRADMVGTLTIRQIYARLLSRARKAGYPRAPQQTPNEYLRVLAGALPDIRPDLEAITSAYLEARYSPYPASTTAVNSANEAWRHIEAAGIGQTPES